MKPTTREDLVTLVKLLGPFAPHLADEAWEALGEQGFVLQATWPQYVLALTGDPEMRLAVQVNGKLRGVLELAGDTSEATVRAQALSLPSVAKHVEIRTVKTILVVPWKIVSIVVE